MSRIRISSTDDVLKLFREDILGDLKARGFAVASEIELSGGCFEVFVAWQRLRHRGIAPARRTVNQSPEILRSNLDSSTRSALLGIQSEFQRGDDMTHRLTRQFYKSGFNDFLFNNFGVHHLHLGAPGVGLDKTKKHPMAGGGSNLLFVLVNQTEVYFLEVGDHQVFERPEAAKAIARVALRNRPDLLSWYLAPGVVGADQTFEDAFQLAKSGFSTVYELDGRFLLTGGTVMDGRVTDGKRAACTSGAVIDAANRVLTMVADLVDYVHSSEDQLIDAAASITGERPSAFDLEVIQAGRSVVLRERNTGLRVFHTGQNLGFITKTQPNETAYTGDRLR